MTGSVRDAVRAKISSTQPDTESEISETKDPLNKWVFFDVHHDNHSGGSATHKTVKTIYNKVRYFSATMKYRSSYGI